jgi:tetratricopeptide (TPR) repeat protein
MIWRMNMAYRPTTVLWMVLCAVGLLFCETGLAAAQSSPPAQPANTQPAPNAAPNATPNSADPYAFPEDESRKAAEAAKRGEYSISVPDSAPAAPVQPDENSAQPNPAPAAPAGSPGHLILPNIPMIPSHENGAEGPDAANDSGISSSRESDDSNAGDTNDPNVPNKPKSESPGASSDTYRRESSSPDSGSNNAVPLDRAEHDEQIADFYANRGNYVGAYLRYEDAVAFAPDDPFAHFGLATVAQKLNKNNEAIKEYELYLKLDPGGDKQKEALRALNTLLRLHR